MKHSRIRTAAWFLTALALTGVASAVQAGPPGANPDQARAAIEEARQLRDALQFHLTEPEAKPRTLRSDAHAGQTPRKVNARVPRSGPVDAARQRPERRRTEDRSADHARRSLSRISEHLATAESSFARNPAFALHRADLALHELRKVERRLGIRLELAEVQP